MTPEKNFNIDEFISSLSRADRHFLIYNSTCLMTLEGTLPETVEIAERLFGLGLLLVGNDNLKTVRLTELGARVVARLRGLEDLYDAVSTPNIGTGSTREVVVPRGDPERVAGMLTEEYVNFLRNCNGMVFPETSPRLLMLAEFFIAQGCLEINHARQIIVTDFGNRVLIVALGLKRKHS